MKKQNIVREIILSGVCILLLQCMKPLPPPGGVNAVFDAAVSDDFSCFVADCGSLLSGDRTSKAAFWVQSCLDLKTDEEVDKCMVKGIGDFTKDALVCLLVDLNVEWQRQIASELGNELIVGNSIRANQWIKRHQIGVRR